MIVEMLETLRKKCLAEGIEPNQPASAVDIKDFETHQQVLLPSDLRAYFLTLNGIVEGQMDGLLRLWALSELRPLPDYLWTPGGYADAALAVLATDPSSKKGNIHRLAEPTKLTENGDSKSPAIFVLPDAKRYFIFADYNIEGGHWAIKLNSRNGSENPIIYVSSSSNSYWQVANHFEEYIDRYTKGSPEDLI